MSRPLHSAGAVHADWGEANQEYLSLSLKLVKEVLHFQLDHLNQKDKRPELLQRLTQAGEHELAKLTQSMSEPPAIVTLCKLFQLSEFERYVLLLCAGIELEASFSALCASLTENSPRHGPTFGLALAVLPQAHWSALVPRAPLRFWRLVELGQGDGLTSSTIKIDERVLHYLVGLHYLDDHLSGYVRRVDPSEANLVPSHNVLVEKIALNWRNGDAQPPLVQLCGKHPESKRNIAGAAAANVGLHLYAMPSHVLPTEPQELDALVHLWEREALLGNQSLLLECDGAHPLDDAREMQVRHFMENVNGAVMVASEQRRKLAHRSSIIIDVAKPTSAEQSMLWAHLLGVSAKQMNGQVRRLADHFDLSAQTIAAIGAEAMHESDSADDLKDNLWSACRVQARPNMDDLAVRVVPVAGWDDLVLPGTHIDMLKDVALQVRNRSKVYKQWGFANKGKRGLGISALFCGPSGTGKTMAAEVLARDLNLDLYIIDLSQVVSKYIGETEKNLGRVFDAAEEGGTILLFDEADALFGKRSEIKDSHDRYANIEVSYLLQRMESYRGLAVLTTNLKSAIDDAFLRRIRFVINFPFPDAAQRAEIWRRIYPEETPTETLDYTRLSRLNIAGGNIRNIALQAAFIAAEENKPVGMAEILRGARNEYSKLEKPLTDDLGVRL